MWTDNGSMELAELKQWVDAKYTTLKAKRQRERKEQSITSLLNDLLQLETLPLAPLDMRVLQELEEEDYTIRTLIFQSQEGVFISANLYIPTGVGPFPALLNSHGHWDGGKAGDIVQQTAQRMVHAGYVVLCIDAWGAGERGSQQQEEYHGGNLGAALFDIGTSLLALQLIDNKQAVNLLCSLPFVDKNRIGAVGASGGGNQTLWITAYDARIKAAVPVVSIGTFEGYLLQRNCVCELLPNGLHVLEAKDLLSSIGPRFVHILSASQEDIPAFQPAQMLRVYQEASAEQQANLGISCISFKLFQETHHFSAAMQDEALAFFNEKLGGNRTTFGGTYSYKEPDMLRTKGLTDVNVTLKGTLDYVQQRQHQTLANLELKDRILEDDVLIELHKRLAIDACFDTADVARVTVNAGAWHQQVLKTKKGQTIHLLLKDGDLNLPLRLIVPAKGTAAIGEEEKALFLQYQGIVVLMDVFGMRAQQTANMALLDEGLPVFHSLSRSLLWLGETLVGRWVSDIRLVVDFLRQQKAAAVHLLAYRETAVASLCYQALYRGADKLELSELPLSLMPGKTSASPDPLNMAAHIPNIITWGDVSLLRALINIPIVLKQPIDRAGHALTNKQIDDFAAWVSVLRKKIEKMNVKKSTNLLYGNR